MEVGIGKFYKTRWRSWILETKLFENFHSEIVQDILFTQFRNQGVSSDCGLLGN